MNREELLSEVPSPMESTVVVENSSFQNRDFRTNHGISVIDPETYEGLRRAQNSIYRALPFQLVPLFLILCIGAVLLPRLLAPTTESDPGWVFLVAAIGSFLLAFVIFRYISKVLFKKADNKVIALVESYKAQFLDSFDVELGHRLSTKSVRWWTNDSVIYLRRPRRQPTPPAAASVEEQATTSFPPIFIDLVIPGDIHVQEQHYDASMKVDATAWNLLQETHREMISYSHTVRVFFSIYCIFLLIFFSSGFWFVDVYGFLPFVILCALVVGVTYVIARVHDRRNLRLYQEVSQRVTEALQKEDGSADLVVEFTSSELPGRVPLNFRRYQFVRTLATTGTPTTAEIV
jgi:hypothetical protein